MLEHNDTKNLLSFVWKYFATQDFDCLTLRKSLIDICGGSHTTALMISQILYWHNKFQDTDRWIKITYEEWFQQIRLTERKLKTALNKARALKLIETKVMRFNGITSLHFKINFNNLSKSLEEYELNSLNGRNVQSQQIQGSCRQNVQTGLDKTSIPEWTKRPNVLTKNTTKNTYYSYGHLSMADPVDNFSNKSDYGGNQVSDEIANQEGLESIDLIDKSDYHNNQTFKDARDSQH